MRAGGHEGGGGRQVSRAQITHRQERVDFALSRRGDRAWDGTSEARWGAKKSQLGWCPTPRAAYCCVGFGQVASSFWATVLPSVKWALGSYEGGHQTGPQCTLP